MIVWKPIEGWPYEVSNTGLVRRQRTNFVLTPMRTGQKRKQYSTVRLCNCGVEKDRKVAELVLEAFISTRPNGLVARHLNDDTFDNSLSNLRWGTHRENANDRRFNTPVKLTVSQAVEIRRRRKNERGADLAREFNVSQQTVCDISKGRIHTGNAK